jgi:hypothetical protein
VLGLSINGVNAAVTVMAGDANGCGGDCAFCVTVLPPALCGVPHQAAL